MAFRAPGSTRAPRLNPFAFPLNTNLRFALHIAVVVAVGIYYGSSLEFLFLERNTVSILKDAFGGIRSEPPTSLSNVEELLRLFRQRGQQFYPELWRITIVKIALQFGSIALMLGLAWMIYWFFPAWKIRRLSPLSANDAPELVNYLENLCQEAGVVGRPVFLLDPRPTSDALAFGRLGRYYVVLPHWLATQLFHTDQARFRAIVLHEFAHLRNADVDKTSFTVALWQAFVVVVLMPALVSYIVSLFGFGRWHGSRGGYILGLLALTAWVYLTRNAVLRARELYADVRTSVWEWDGLHHQLEEVCSHSKGKGWRGLWQQQYHPEPAERLRMLHDTSPLFRLGFWDALGAGMATTFGLLNTVMSIKGWEASLVILSLFTFTMPYRVPNMLPLAVWWLGPVLIFVSLAIGVVGLGIWRQPC